jgi:hypothetical protein
MIISIAMLTKSHSLVYVFGSWMLVVLAVLALLDSLSIEYFFVLSLLGFLIIVELSGPFTVRPAWRYRVNIIIAFGIVVFAFIVMTKVLNILGITLFT